MFLHYYYYYYYYIKAFVIPRKLFHAQHHIVALVCVSFCPQIENANDVLIMPLERFRKEQISAAKVRRRQSTATGLVTETHVYCASVLISWQ